MGLRTVVDIRLTTDRADHVADVSLSNNYFEVMLETVAADVALATRRA